MSKDKIERYIVNWRVVPSLYIWKYRVGGNEELYNRLIAKHGNPFVIKTITDKETLNRKVEFYSISKSNEAEPCQQ